MSETKCDSLVCQGSKKLYETTLGERKVYQDSLLAQLKYQQEENSKLLDTIQKYEKFIVRLKLQINKLQREKQVVNKPFRTKTLKRQFFTEGISSEGRIKDPHDSLAFFREEAEKQKAAANEAYNVAQKQKAAEVALLKEEAEKQKAANEAYNVAQKQKAAEVALLKEEAEKQKAANKAHNAEVAALQDKLYMYRYRKNLHDFHKQNHRKKGIFSRVKRAIGITKTTPRSSSILITPKKHSKKTKEKSREEAEEEVELKS